MWRMTPFRALGLSESAILQPSLYRLSSPPLSQQAAPNGRFRAEQDAA